jgi:hypothetical protein
MAMETGVIKDMAQKSIPYNHLEMDFSSLELMMAHHLRLRAPLMGTTASLNTGHPPMATVSSLMDTPQYQQAINTDTLPVVTTESSEEKTFIKERPNKTRSECQTKSIWF